MRKFRIDRKRWRTGKASLIRTGVGLTSLKNAEGYLCCLGFACNQLGRVKQDDLIGEGSPAELNKAVLGLSFRDGYGEVHNTPLSRSAIRINDEEAYTSRKQREKDLVRLFRRNDIQVEFYGEYDF